MERKHTPGAWYVWGWDDPAGTPLRIRTEHNPASLPAERRPGPIASVLPQPDEAQQEANARLIAAAPVLLEVCLEVAEWIREAQNLLVEVDWDGQVLTNASVLLAEAIEQTTRGAE